MHENETPEQRAKRISEAVAEQARVKNQRREECRIRQFILWLEGKDAEGEAIDDPTGSLYRFKANIVDARRFTSMLGEVLQPAARIIGLGAGGMRPIKVALTLEEETEDRGLIIHTNVELVALGTATIKECPAYIARLTSVAEHLCYGARNPSLGIKLA